MSTFIVSADFVGPGEFYTLSKPSSEYVFTANVLQHSTNGRVLLTTAFDPTVSLYQGAVISSEGTTTLHLATASSQGAVLVSGMLRNSNADGTALRLWGAGSITNVYEDGLIVARGATGTAINLAVDSANTTAKINNYGEILGFRAIDRFGSENVQILNTGRIAAESGGTAYRDMFGGVDVIFNNGTIFGQIEFGGGADVYNGQNGHQTGRVYGGEGNDVLRGGLSGVTFYGENGEDELSGSVVGDYLYAGDGNDQVWGGGGSDLIEGWSGNDTVYGDAGTDTVYGNTGDDEIRGGTDNDILWGQEDNDILVGNAGIDTMIGGSGNDKIYVENPEDIVVEAVGEGDDAVFASVSYTLLAGVEVERLAASDSGSTKAMTLTGNEIAQEISGNQGVNKLTGLDGNDRLFGYGGEDKLYGGAGDDRLSGGTAGDQLYGGSGVDLLTGETGDDLLDGAGDIDRLYGNEGEDVLYGGSSNDALSGGDQDDRLYGDSGGDTMTGGAGADKFVYRALTDSMVNIWSRDLITDFSRADGDLIHLSTLDADSVTSGNQAFNFIGTDAFSDTAGELRYKQEGGDTFVLADVDGDGASDFIITFDVARTFIETDFVL